MTNQNGTYDLEKAGHTNSNACNVNALGLSHFSTDKTYILKCTTITYKLTHKAFNMCYNINTYHYNIISIGTNKHKYTVCHGTNQ